MFKSFPLFLSLMTAITAWASEQPSPFHESLRNLQESVVMNVQDFQFAPSEEPGAALFSSPVGWSIADAKQLPKSVKIMVIGKGEYQYPPSINLGMEKFNGTLKDYLKIVKRVNEAQGIQWKDLGKIKTDAGNGSLSQLDLVTEWGAVRMMHLIIVKSGMTYIMTVAARKEEFPSFYQDFFASMHSLHINKNAIEMLPIRKQRTDLQKARKQLLEEWKSFVTSRTEDREQSSVTTFENREFQTQSWHPFETMIISKFSAMGVKWQQYILNEIKQELLAEVMKK